MKLTEYKKIFKIGIAGMLCKVIDNNIFIYGGSNFPNRLPPFGEKKVYNDMYIFDKNFKLLVQKKGKIKPNYGISIQEKNIIWYILGKEIFKIEINNLEIIEEKFIDIPEELDSGFGCLYKGNLIFGKEKIYKLNLKTKNIEIISVFPAKVRSQSIYYNYKEYLYILGGANNICYLDSYRYNLDKNEWEKLNNIPVSFTGAAYCEFEKGKIIILGGFNKEIYDDVVPKLSNIEYKKEYFNLPREYFKWNDNIYLYDVEKDKFSILGQDRNTAICGGSLVKLKEEYFLINGEVKPGLRSSFVYKMEYKI